MSQKSILLLCLLPATCTGMLILPSDIVRLIFCHLLCPPNETNKPATESEKEKSIAAIDALKKAQLVCKAWYREGNSVTVTDYFLENLAYDPKCGIYSSCPKTNDYLYGLHATPQAILYKSLKPHVEAEVKNYFLKHPENDQLHEIIRRKIQEEGKLPFKNYPEIYGATQYYQDKINLSYRHIYAALNLNTQAARTWVITHLMQNRHKIYHTLLGACLYGKKILVSQLVAHGANPNQAHDEMSSPRPLHVAISYNHADIVQELLKSPLLKTEEQDWNNETPLAKALHLRNPEIIQLLMQDPRVNILEIPTSSMRLPPQYRFETANAFIYVGNFVLDMPPETRDYIAQKVQEQKKIQGF